MTGWIKRQRERRGTMPANVRAELEAEGIEMLEEKIAANVLYRHYIVAGQRPTSGEQNDDPRARPHAEAARAPRARATSCSTPSRAR